MIKKESDVKNHVVFVKLVFRRSYEMIFVVHKIGHLLLVIECLQGHDNEEEEEEEAKGAE